jgi:hypothetical protein
VPSLAFVTADAQTVPNRVIRMYFTTPEHDIMESKQVPITPTINFPSSASILLFMRKMTYNSKTTTVIIVPFKLLLVVVFL